MNAIKNIGFSAQPIFVDGDLNLDKIISLIKSRLDFII